jgi:hypothetical protein
MCELIEEYTWCSAYFEYRQSKNRTFCSPGISSLCRNPNTAGATLSGTPSSKEQQNSAGEASFCCAVCRSNISPPAVPYHHAGANCSAGNPPPRGNLGLKRTPLKKIYQKMNLFFFKCPAGSYKLQIYPITPYAAFPNLVRISL